MRFTKPVDGWGANIRPRKWQEEAFEIFLKHYSVDKPAPALMRAIMASGKSILMAQILASSCLSKNELIVVSTSSIHLVEQLQDTFNARLCPEGFQLEHEKVGCFYTHSKSSHTPVIVCCTNSLPDLARIIKQKGQKCALYIPDECHKTEVATVHAALGDLNPERIFGVSATPFRSDVDQRLSIFKKLLYDYGPAQAIADKVVVPWRIMPWDGGESDLDTACIQMATKMSGPGMFNATSIADAELFTIKLKDAGWMAETVHSKLKRAEVKRRMAALVSGDIQCLTHVNSLVEGCDIPALRWLCLRRPVSARVRFIQEIGRTLRSYNDKDGNPIKYSDGSHKECAFLLDPHGLFDAFSLDYEAVLGGEYEVDEPDKAELSESEKEEKLLGQLVFDMMRAIVDANAGKAPLNTPPLAGYLRELVTVFDACGLIERKITSREWRKQGSTSKQQTAINNLKWVTTLKRVPKIHQQALGMLTGCSGAINRGMGSDLLSIMMSLANNRKWPDLKVLDQSAQENIEKHSKPGPKITMTQAPSPYSSASEIQKKKRKKGNDATAALFNPNGVEAG